MFLGSCACIYNTLDMAYPFTHTKCSPFSGTHSIVLLHFAHTHHTHTLCCSSHTLPVTNLKAVNTTTNSTTITWDQPPHNYRVFLHGEATDNIPQSRVIQLVDVTGQTTYIVEGLNSFRNYSISVFLASDNGNGSDETVIVTTTGRGQGMLLCACIDCV